MSGAGNIIIGLLILIVLAYFSKGALQSYTIPFESGFTSNIAGMADTFILGLSILVLLLLPLWFSERSKAKKKKDESKK